MYTPMRTPAPTFRDKSSAVSIIFRNVFRNAKKSKMDGADGAWDEKKGRE